MMKVRNAIYIGGEFTGTVDGAVTGLNNIAKLEDGKWQSLPGKGLRGEGVRGEWVSDILESQGDLYVSGYFSQTGDGSVQGLHNIARLRNGKWQSLPNGGLDSAVWSMAIVDKDLYVSGPFSRTADNKVKHLNYLAHLHLSSSLGLIQDRWQVMPNGGLNDIAFDLAAVGNVLYVGGQFTKTFDKRIERLNYIARFSGGTWHSLPFEGLDFSVSTLSIIGNKLYLGGQFYRTYKKPYKGLASVAEFSDGKWRRLPRHGFSLAAEDIYSIAKVGGDLYVSGDLYSKNSSSIDNYFAVLSSPQ